MKNGKYCNKKSLNMKPLALLLALTLLLGCGIGGTLAWLLDTSGTVTNTFTSSDIEVTLTETGASDGAKEYKMVPGMTLSKDPKAMVSTISEDCYLFVKVEEENGVVTYTKAGATTTTTTSWADFLTYTVAEGWTKLTDGTDEGTEVDSGVYYKIFKDGSGNTKGTAYSILAGDSITVKDTVTKEMMKALTADNYPKLKFTAYAAQLKKSNDTEFEAEEAWKLAKVNPAN